MQADASQAAHEAFAASHARVDTMVDWLASDQAAGMTHAELEDRLYTMVWRCCANCCKTAWTCAPNANSAWRRLPTPKAPLAAAPSTATNGAWPPSSGM